MLVADDAVTPTDFGIATTNGATGSTATGQPAGFAGTSGARADQWGGQYAGRRVQGLGLTLYAVLTGRSPFHREDFQTVFVEVLSLNRPM